MSFRVNFKLILGMACGVATFSACHPPDQKLNRQQREERIVKFLDDRRFDDAIASATEPEFAHYRAQAHLGKSGFIPLEFAARVMGAQSAADASARDAQLGEIISGCDPKAVPEMRGVSYRCVLWRIFRQLPEAEQPDFARAREILRETFSDPRQSPAGYNALCGIVEMASLLASFRSILLNYHALDTESSSDGEIAELFAEIARFADYALETLRRARVLPYGNISRHLAGVENDAFLSGNRLNLDYVENSGIPLVIRIAQSTSDGLDVIGGKIMMIQQLDRVIQLLQPR